MQVELSLILSILYSTRGKASFRIYLFLPSVDLTHEPIQNQAMIQTYAQHQPYKAQSRKARPQTTPRMGCMKCQSNSSQVLQLNKRRVTIMIISSTVRLYIILTHPTQLTR